MRTVNGIQFKTTTCTNSDNISYKINDNAIALYIVLTRACNTNCKFCEFHNGTSEIDLDKFEDTLDRLLKFCYITTVHFTGGEPTLELDKLIQLCNIIKYKDKLIKTSVNTNGTNLSKLSDIKNLDNIALSRHEIDDKKNQEIFGSQLVPSANDIKNFKDKQKIHLSCNLIKGHIDCSEKVIEYLEFASKLDIIDIGMVSLMDINDYCKNNFIDFENIKLPISQSLIQSRCLRNINDSNEICCRCINYLYQAKNMKMLSLYHRFAVKGSSISDYLVYEDNILKQGFNGKPIELDNTIY